MRVQRQGEGNIMETTKQKKKKQKKFARSRKRTTEI